MAERETFLDEDEYTRNLDDFTLLLRQDMQKHDGTFDLMCQFEELSTGLNQLHEKPAFSNKKED